MFVSPFIGLAVRLSVCTFMSIWISICRCPHVCLTSCVCLCAHLSVCLSNLNVYLSASTYLLYALIRISSCTCVSKHASVCPSVCACVSAYLSVPACVPICLCLRVCRSESYKIVLLLDLVYYGAVSWFAMVGYDHCLQWFTPVLEVHSHWISPHIRCTHV